MTLQTSVVSPFPLEPTLDTLRRDHAVQLSLCDDLEVVADRLPILPSRTTVESLCECIELLAHRHYRRAEHAFSRLPRDRQPTDTAAADITAMHQLDEMHGEDLASALRASLDDPANANVGQLAYMLRCYFDGLRRAIALKESWMTHIERDLVKAG